MKEIVSTKFFLTMQEASQAGISVDTHVLRNCHDEFVRLLFSVNAVFKCKTAFLDTLDYTRVEMKSLTERVSKKKRTGFSKKGYSPY
jgi:hypothetical protein